MSQIKKISGYRSDLTKSVLCGLKYQKIMSISQLISYCACHDEGRVRNAVRKLLKKGDIIKHGTKGSNVTYSRV